MLVQTIDLGNKQIFSVINSNNLHELIKLIKSTPFSIPFVRSKIDRCLNSILRQWERSSTTSRRSSPVAIFLNLGTKRVLPRKQ